MIDRERVVSVMRTKRAARRREIESLRARALVRGATDDPGYWTLVHDLECAPITTNLAQLGEIGVAVPDERWLDDDEVSRSLATIIEGLALLEVFLRHTDHLDDRMLHRELRCRVLVEAVRDVPAGVGCREWIDLAAGRDSSAFLAVHASDEERSDAARRGEVVPPRLRRLADRDGTLPSPSDPPPR